MLWGAFPVVYATLFSAFYLALLLMLAGLILRGVAFELRYKAERMRPVLDLGFAGGSLVAAFIQGMMTDELDIKLHALAELRQPSVDTHLSKKDLGLARQSAMSEEAEPGSYPTYAVRDFIRAQVERRWGLDLRTLGDSNYSVLIRVEMTSTGAVTKAEIADTARFNSDTTYRAIALSARNAVLLSSPFVLPGGPYSDRMVFTLSLNTKEALR